MGSMPKSKQNGAPAASKPAGKNDSDGKATANGAKENAKNAEMFKNAPAAENDAKTKSNAPS